jgi:hypothetical protein
MSTLKLEKTTILAICLATAGLFTYSEVVKKEHEIHMKQSKYEKMVKDIRTNNR